MRKLITTVLFVALLAGVGYFGFLAVRNRQVNINQWFLAGQTRGVDISAYQEGVDFTKLKEQGIEFAYIKATEGANYVDPEFSEYFAAAKEADVAAGAYHYFKYGVSGAEQARNFIQTVGELEGRLIPAVDMELTAEEVMNPPEKEVVTVALKAFLAVLEEEYQVKPLIYAQQDYYEKYLKDDFSEYPRWVRNVFYPVYIGAGDNWAVWQYNDRGELEGYRGEKCIDLNVVNAKIGIEKLKM